MRQLITGFVLIILLFTNGLNAQVKLPAPSPQQNIKQNFGLGTIEIIYSRPSAKGRRVFGDLVSYNQLWRTGANEATRITFTSAVELYEKKIDSGTYVLYCIPNKDTWEIILNKGLKNWGTDGYNENEDVIRFKIEPDKSKTVVETFTIQFSDIEPASCIMELVWEKTIIKIPITADINEKMQQQINAAMQTDKKPYWEAAQFYFEYDRNLIKALENINKALEANNKAYWMYLYKANIQKEMGDNTGALNSSSISIELATKASNNDYIKMNKELQKELKK